VTAVFQDSGEFPECADVLHQRIDTCLIEVEGLGQLVVQFRACQWIVVEQLVDVLYNLHAGIVVSAGQMVE
jgi:hypothetical protein